MLALCACKACCSRSGIDCWSIDWERKLPPSLREAIPTFVILLPETVTETDREP
jgi:hypothetical protein